MTTPKRFDVTKLLRRSAPLDVNTSIIRMSLRFLAPMGAPMQTSWTHFRPYPGITILHSCRGRGPRHSLPTFAQGAERLLEHRRAQV